MVVVELVVAVDADDDDVDDDNSFSTVLASLTRTFLFADWSLLSAGPVGSWIVQMNQPRY